MPVLEDDSGVVEFVTVDDVIDELMIEEQTEDMLRMAAVEPGALGRLFRQPDPRVVRKRIGWLLFLFVAGTLTGRCCTASKTSWPPWSRSPSSSLC